MGAITINSLSAALLWVWSVEPVWAQGIFSPALCEKQYEEDGHRKEYEKCLEAARQVTFPFRILEKRTLSNIWNHSIFAQGPSETTPAPTETTSPSFGTPGGDPGTPTPPAKPPPSQPAPDPQSSISITTTQISGAQSASPASSGSAANQASDSLHPVNQTSNSVPGLTTEYQAVSPTPGPPSSTGSILPNPAQTIENDHHIPIGPIVGAIVPIIILLIAIFIYCVRRKRIGKRSPWISPWISEPESPNSSGGKLKQPSDPEKRLLSQLDLTERNDEVVDLLEDLSPMSFQEGTQQPVAGHDKESQLRDFICNHYAPSSPSELPSLGTSDRPPPY
jgi:hypothetical protein